MHGLITKKEELGFGGLAGAQKSGHDEGQTGEGGGDYDEDQDREVVKGHEIEFFSD